MAGFENCRFATETSLGSAILRFGNHAYDIEFYSIQLIPLFFFTDYPQKFAAFAASTIDK